MSGGKTLDRITIKLRDIDTGDILPVYLDIFDNSLSKKWLASLNALLQNRFHLEKNFCFVGFVDNKRNGEYILERINQTIQAINQSGIGYHIDDFFSMENCMIGNNTVKDKFNGLHRYFEDLQGVSGKMTEFYVKADAATRWHIRQVNLLCHEFEYWAMSYKKSIEAPQWQRPSQLMCWLNSPRFVLDDEDFELFGIETVNRPLGAVYVGVNKAVGKHHWEVFNDEGRDSRIEELTTTTLRSQTEASGDFDIEWANNPGGYEWQKQRLKDFRDWLTVNGFDPDDPKLTIGHPQIGQVDLYQSFQSTDFNQIWKLLNTHLDVYEIVTHDASAVYDYHWRDKNYADKQIGIIGGHQ